MGSKCWAFFVIRERIHYSVVGRLMGDFVVVFSMI
jgi:hypothetical protein